jgi:hypothetical protein
MVLRIKLQDKFNTDETAIVFKQGFDAAFGSLDATYLAGSSVSMSSQTSDRKNVAINFMPEISNVAEIGLTVNSIANGNLKMNFTNLSSINNYQVFLKDSFLNSLTNIREKSVYDFAVDRANQATFGADRFKLVFEKGPIPGVSYLSFTGEVVSRGINVKWSSKTEYNNFYFEVERSANGVSFTKAGRVEGGGTSTIRLDYNFLDEKPAPGINYYRLRQYDFKGICIYSVVISVNYSKLVSDIISIYPNPAKTEFNLDLSAIPHQTIQVNIYDVRSLKLKSFTYDFSKSEVINQDVSNLISGIYTIEIVGLKDKVVLKRLKFIKE